MAILCVCVDLLGWGRSNGVPLLRVPIVQQFICQDGDLPAPGDRNILIPRLNAEHLANAELKPVAPPAIPGGVITSPLLLGQAFSSPPGAVSAAADVA